MTGTTEETTEGTMPRRTTHLTPAARPRLSRKALTRKEFADRLYALMVERGWTQSELARKAGIERDSVSRYMNQKNLPDANNLEKMAKAFGIAAADLYPNFDIAAIDNDDEDPVIEMRVIEADPTRALLIIRREMPTAMAAKVIAILSEEIESSEPKKRGAK